MSLSLNSRLSFMCAFLFILPLALSCQSTVEERAKEPSLDRSVGLPAGLFLEHAPENVLTVKDAKEIAEAGEPIVVRGRVGGSVRPFVEGRAVFTIVGRGPHACSDYGDDHCDTGWDYCCTPPDELLAHSATVRIVDSDGRPIRTNVRGHAGIKELSDLTISGRVHSAERGTLVVDASAIYVNPPEDSTASKHEHHHHQHRHDP